MRRRKYKDVITHRRITDSNELRIYGYYDAPEMSKKERENLNRLDLVDMTAKKLHYFEIDKGHFTGPEIHCLMQDATILVFNKKSKKLESVILATDIELDHYIDDHIYTTEQPAVINVLYENGELNYRTKANQINDKIWFSNLEAKEYHRQKAHSMQRVNHLKDEKEFNDERLGVGRHFAEREF